MNICGTVADCQDAGASVCLNNTVLGLAATGVWKVANGMLQLTYQNTSG